MILFNSEYRQIFQFKEDITSRRVTTELALNADTFMSLPIDTI